jgi:hypothetical protein
VSCGQDFRGFWQTPLREIHHVINGTVARETREHNSRAWLAWHIARVSVYPPEKASDFPKLQALLWGDKPKPKPKPDWRRSEAAFAAWVQSYKR